MCNELTETYGYYLGSWGTFSINSTFLHTCYHQFCQILPCQVDFLSELWVFISDLYHDTLIINLSITRKKKNLEHSQKSKLNFLSDTVCKKTWESKDLCMVAWCPFRMNASKKYFDKLLSDKGPQVSPFICGWRNLISGTCHAECLYQVFPLQRYNSAARWNPMNFHSWFVFVFHYSQLFGFFHPGAFLCQVCLSLIASPIVYQLFPNLSLFRLSNQSVPCNVFKCCIVVMYTYRFL